MNIKNVAGHLVGSVAVYVAVVACSELATGSNGNGNGGVGDVNAAEEELDVSTAPCEGEGGNAYAFKDYPGLTRDQLTRVRSYHDNFTGPPGFTGFMAGRLYVTDGRVAASCNAPSTVTFVLPK